LYSINEIGSISMTVRNIHTVGTQFVWMIV